MVSSLYDGEAVMQTATNKVFNMQLGETQTLEWGINPDTDVYPVFFKLRATGAGSELLSFPETVEFTKNEWKTIDIIITIPEDYQNNVKLTPFIFARMETGQEQTGTVGISIQLKALPIILIGEPPYEEPGLTPQVEETFVEPEEKKPTETPQQEATPFVLESPEEESIPSVTESPEEGGGCLISTATFGSELAPQVQMLREIRDNKLLVTESGSAFMSGFNSLYYSFSPTIADWERESPVFREAVKITLTPLITSLSILNYVDMDSEAKVLGYGISLILLNIGMYFIAPAILITRLRR